MAGKDVAELERNRRMISELRQRGSVATDRVAEAFAAVPRHAFLPGTSVAEAYSATEAVPIRRNADGMATSSSSAPSIMGPMLEQLELRSGAHVLEVGTGSGYNAALLDVLVGPAGSVTTIDLQPELAEEARSALARTGHGRVDVRSGNGWQGVPDRAPFDAIEVTAGADDISPRWAEQLRDGGVTAFPLGLRGGIQVSVAFRKDGRRFRSRGVVPCGFMRLQGGGEPTAAAVKVGTSIALFDAPELSTAVESLLRLEPAIEAAPEPPTGWFERAALGETDLVPISMFEEGSWTDRRGFLDPDGKGLALISGSRIWAYGAEHIATQLRDRIQRATPLDLQRLIIEAVPTPAESVPETTWSLVRPCFTFFVREG